MAIKRCPVCATGKVGVLDSRQLADGAVCRRRYKCACGHRFSTYEIVMTDENDEWEGGDHAAGKRLGLIASKRILGDSFEPL